MGARETVASLLTLFCLTWPKKHLDPVSPSCRGFEEDYFLPSVNSWSVSLLYMWIAKITDLISE